MEGEASATVSVGEGSRAPTCMTVSQRGDATDGGLEGVRGNALCRA